MLEINNLKKNFESGTEALKGVNLKAAEVVQVGQALEQGQIQQEKQ